MGLRSYDIKYHISNLHIRVCCKEKEIKTVAPSSIFSAMVFLTSGNLKISIFFKARESWSGFQV